VRLLLARSQQVGSFAVNACGYPALAQKQDRDSLTYGELLEKIEAGKVAKIERDSQQTAKVQLEAKPNEPPPQQVIVGAN